MALCSRSNSLRSAVGGSGCTRGAGKKSCDSYALAAFEDLDEGSVEADDDDDDDDDDDENS